VLDRLAHAIVKGRKAILAIAALLLVFAAFGLINSSINYDLLSYLPEELDSTKGFAILNDDFALANTAQVIVVGASEPEVAMLVESIEGIDGIEQVAWVDDAEDLAVPKEFWTSGLEDTYFAGDTTFFQVSFTESSNDPLTRSAVEEMRGVLEGYETYVAGTQQLELEDVINADRTNFAIAALVLVAIVLVLTIPSVIIPVLFVVTIGAAVFYNLGMGYYIGQEMSYLTGVIVFALQFAVTMDYALFLYHRYEQERVDHDNEKAMEVAIATTFKSVISAAATTTAGFLALTAMQLGFGEDMGLTLARGVVITVIAVLTILPALLLTFDKVVRRFSHRVFMPDFHALGGWLARHAGALTLVFVLLFVPALWGYNQVVLDYNLDSALPDDLPSIQAQDRLAEEFGRYQTFFVMLEDTGSTREIDALATRVGELEGVTEVFAYTEFFDPLIPEEFVPDEARENLFKNGYTYISADVEYDFADPRTLDLLDELRASAEAYPGAAYVTGESVLYTDMEQLSQDDVGRVNTISIIAIAIIIAIAFKSVTIPAVLLAVIQLAILFNQGLSGLAGAEIQFIAILAIGAIQLGATVDYAIILTTRYEEELGRAGDRETAMREALGGAAPSILTSAATMFAATVGIVVLASVTTISDLTMLISRGAVISFFVVVFLLPPLLVIGQPVYQWTSYGWPRAKPRCAETDSCESDDPVPPREQS
jgi:predicted RND superfamily exporter protein